MTTDTQTETRERKNVEEMNFTDVEYLRRFVTDTGKILPRRITRLSAKQQRIMTRLVKRARSMLLMK